MKNHKSNLALSLLALALIGAALVLECLPSVSSMGSSLYPYYSLVPLASGLFTAILVFMPTALAVLFALIQLFFRKGRMGMLLFSLLGFLCSLLQSTSLGNGLSVGITVLLGTAAVLLAFWMKDIWQDLGQRGKLRRQKQRWFLRIPTFLLAVAALAVFFLPMLLDMLPQLYRTLFHLDTSWTERKFGGILGLPFLLAALELAMLLVPVTLAHLFTGLGKQLQMVLPLVILGLYVAGFCVGGFVDIQISYLVHGALLLLIFLLSLVDWKKYGK